MQNTDTTATHHIALLRQRGERRIFLSMGVAMSAIAALWTIGLMAQGQTVIALIPGGYILLAAITYLGLRLKGPERAFRQILLIAGSLLPFVFQAVLGGCQPSGLAMLWCLPTLVAAVNLQTGYVRYGYLVVTALLLTLFAGLDPAWSIDGSTIGLSPQGLLAFNLGTVMPANFLLADRMLQAQRDMRRQVFAIKREAEHRFVQALEERNREMQESMAYAGRIQMALWPDRMRMKGLFKDYLVLYQPKEAVGGDLVWHARVDDRSYFMVLDCTGHGVPGSLMSMLMHGLLNEVVHTGRTLSAAQVVRRTQQLLDDRLDRRRTGNTDGAEMAVLCFDHTRREVTSCSLGCGIIVQDGNQMLHLKSHSSNASLMNASRLDDLQEHRIQVGPDTRLFLYTDGVADQFCADDQRKFTRSRLENTLRKVSHLSTSQQVEYFRTMFDKWRGDTPPVDDVLLVGLMPDPCWYTIACDEAATDAA